MNSTAKILEDMDGIQFEKICGPILRKMIPELINLIPSGINIDGRVVKSLADGFAFIAQTRYATVHITTNTSNLQKKWLYNGEAKSTPKGDLIKSINQAREMHHVRPDQKFDIFLVYNRQVDDKLHILVNQSITDEFISVRIIEQRELALFLDYDPEGQYLRKHLLGIDATRITSQLLKEIVKVNLSRYAEENYLDDFLPAKTSTRKKVEDSLRSSTKTVNLLTGDSGFGKSTLCYAMMHSIVSNGQITLRVKQSVVENAASLKEAIHAQLKIDYPGVFVQDKDIDDEFQNTLVVIDDINKSVRPSMLLDKIISWNEEKQNGSISVLCPVWPQNLNNLDNTIQKKDKFLVISLDRLSFYDCKDIIQQRTNNNLITLTDQQIHALIFDTGFDPLLINFSLELLKDSQEYDESVPAMAIENYISDKINQLHGPYQIFQIKRALNLFGREMLKNRIIDPEFCQVEQWLSRDSEELRLINLIATDRKLFLFDAEGKIYFRHDRVRNYLLTLSASELIDRLDENKDIFNDPYYAEIIGASLANSSMSKEAIESLLLSNPLAVFLSLKYLQRDLSEDKRCIVMAAILAWRNSVSIELVPKAIIENIAYELVAFDVKGIESITNGFPESVELCLAKFRNGIWLSAVFFFSSVDYFYPEAPMYWWNSILAHVKVKYLDTIIRELGTALSTRFTLEGIAHAYTLVGFLQERVFLNPLVQSWDKLNAPRNYPAYLWAIFNSVTKDDLNIIIHVLSYWPTLTAEEKSTKLLYKSLASLTVSEQIRRIRWKFSDDIFLLLVDAGNDEKLQEIVGLLVARVDHPRAMEIVLNVEMMIEVEKYRKDYVAERWDPANTHRKLGGETLDYLLKEFSDTKNNRRRRYLAWRYWAANIEEQIGLTTIHNLIKRNDSLFEDVIIWRVKHHDIAALSSLEELITKKSWLIISLAKVWSERSKAFFLGWLDKHVKNNDSKSLSYALELLQRLDNNDACKILVAYWEKFKFVENAIETALFLSSIETRELADKEIKRLGFVDDIPMPEYYVRNLSGSYFSTGGGLSEENKKDLLFLAKRFAHFYIHYGAKYEGEKERLTRTKIESLLPYLALFDEYAIYHFATLCLKMGASDLCYQKFYPLLRGNIRSKIRFTTEDLKKDIVHSYSELKRKGTFYLGIWFDGPEKLSVTSSMLNEALLSFSKEYHDSDAFFIIVTILERIGTRKDIALINNFFPDFEKQSKKINQLKDNAIIAIKRRSLN